MRSFWSEPYLWIHLAGLAAVPVLLEICLLGFAVGDPVLPVWLEILIVGVIAIAPVLWMQWQRPFYIFGAIAVALRPSQLTEDQRRLLTLFKSERLRIASVAVAIGLFLILRQLYVNAAIAASVAQFLPSARWLGLLWAAIALLVTHLFLQVPFSVLGVMLQSEADFAETPPYPLDAIASSFTILGIQLGRILPPIVPDVTIPPDLPLTSPGTLAWTAADDDPWGTVPTPMSSTPVSIVELGADTVVESTRADVPTSPLKSGSSEFEESTGSESSDSQSDRES